MRTITSQAVWIDADYDKDSASDGKSRYGAYVRDRVSSFAECWDGIYEEALAVHFAATAWQAATGPIMVPGYVRYHRRIRGVQLEHSYWDGSLLASLDLITPWPQQLRESPRWMEQTARGWWRDWLMEFGDAYCEPSDEDLTKAPYLLTTASMRFTVPSIELPQPPVGWRGRGMPDPADLVATARESVAVVVRELNRIVGPVIRALETN